MIVKKQVKEKIANDLVRINGINSLHFDKKNNRLFFIKVVPSYKKNIYKQIICEYKDGACEEIYNFDKKEKFLRFYEDKFLFKRENKLFISKIKKNAKNKKIFSYKYEIGKILKLSDKEIFFEAEINSNDEGKYTFIDNVDFYSNSDGYIAGKRNVIVKYDCETKDFNIISSISENVVYTFYDDKTDRIVYLSTMDGNNYYNYQNVKNYDINSDTIEVIYDMNDFDFDRIFYVDDKYIALGTYNKCYGVNENPEFYELSNHGLKLLCENKFSVNNSLNSDCRHIGKDCCKVIDGAIYYLSTRENKCKLYAFKDNKIEKIYDDLTSVEDFVKIDNKYIISGFDKGKASELYSFENGNTKLLTNINGNLDFNIKKIEYKYEKYDLEGYILYPKDFDSEKKYPAIFEIHGGPKTVYSDKFVHEMYLFAQNGYIVFFTNPVGSDIYDNEFADVRGDYGSRDFENLKVFYEKVIENVPQIDRDRIGVTGGSYGGFMTNWITSHTDIFKAAVTQRCISNFVSFYGVSDIGYYFALDQTRLEKFDVEKLWEHSPLKYVKNVKTPTLVLHSDKDYRCPLEQGIQWFTHLKLNNVETEMVVFHDENHDLSRIGTVKNRVERLYQMLRWFDKYLK